MGDGVFCAIFKKLSKIGFLLACNAQNFELYIFRTLFFTRKKKPRSCNENSMFNDFSKIIEIIVSYGINGELAFEIETKISYSYQSAAYFFSRFYNVTLHAYSTYLNTFKFFINTRGTVHRIPRVFRQYFSVLLVLAKDRHQSSFLCRFLRICFRFSR